MSLINIKNLLLQIPKSKYQDFVNKIICTEKYLKTTGTGSGLMSGIFIEYLLKYFLQENIPDYKSNNVGESDMLILDKPLSIKKLTPSSTSSLALDWSKNPKPNESKLYFTTDIFLYIITTGQMWKTKTDFTEIIKSGFYLIDKDYCKNNITLISNNKSNSIIKSKDIYKMIQYSLTNNLFIELPKISEIYTVQQLITFNKDPNKDPNK